MARALQLARLRPRLAGLSRDLAASFVVFLVALPLCMGIAIASGVPPARGLVTGIIGGLVVGLLAGAPLQVSGPAAGLTVLVWELVQRHGIEMLGPVVIVAGALQVACGLLRMGQWFRAVSPAVIHGMLAGIGVLIVASQFHVMLDDVPRGSGIANLVDIPRAIYDGVFPLDGSVHHIAAGIGMLTLAALVLWSRWAPARLRRVPGSLVGVLAGATAAGMLDLPVLFVDVPASLLDELDAPSAGTLARLAHPDLLIAAVALALVASAETLLSAAAVDRMHEGPRARYDRELAAQGVGNVLCGAVGGLPMTGVIVRSSANVQAGARTRASAILHGLWLLLFVVAAPGLLALVPTASLAAVLVHTGYQLAHPRVLRQLRAHGRGEVAIFATVVIGIVTFDLLTGVAVGFALAAARNLVALARLQTRVEWNADGRSAVLHLSGAATFLCLTRLAPTLESMPRDISITIAHDELRFIDAACFELLQACERQQEQAGGRLVVDWPALSARSHAAVVRPRYRATRRPAAGSIPGEKTSKEIPCVR